MRITRWITRYDESGLATGYRRLRILGLILIPIVLMAVAGLVSYPFVREWLDVRKARNFYTASETDLAAGRVDDALRSLALYLREFPEDTKALKRGAEIAQEHNHPREMHWRFRLLEATPEDRDNASRLVRIVAATRRLELLPEIMTRLERSPIRDAVYWNARSLAAMGGRNLTDAIESARAAARADPDSVQLEANLASLLLLSNAPALREEGRAIARELAEEVNPRIGLPLVIHSLRAENRLEEALRVSEELLGQHFADLPAEELLEHAELVAAVDPDRLEPFLARVREQLTDPLDIAAACRWLIARDETTDALEWLLSLPEEIGQQPIIRLTIADAAHLLRDWDLVIEAMDPAGEPWALGEHLRLAHLAAAYRGTYRLVLAEQTMGLARNALFENGGDPFRFLRVIGNWEGWDAARRDILWDVVERRRDEAFRALRELDAIYRSRGEAIGLLRVMAALRRLQPGDFRWINNVVYFSAVLDRITQDHIRDVAKLLDEHGDEPTILSTCALARLRIDDHSGAQELLERLPAGEQDRPEIAYTLAIVKAALGDYDITTRTWDLAAVAADLEAEAEWLKEARLSVPYLP